MKIQISRVFTSAFTVILAVFAFNGCMTKSDSDPTMDGGNVVVTQETNNMSVVLNESSTSPKTAMVTSDTDSVTKEKIIVLRHYDTICQCFIRSTQFLNKKGFER